MATVRIEIEKAKGYSGKRGNKSYVARIAGTSGTATFDRTFLEAAAVDWGDSQLYKKSKGIWTEAYDLEIGLYEVCEYGEREYKVVWEKEGKTVCTTISAERAEAISELLDKGESVEAARAATKPATA